MDCEYPFGPLVQATDGNFYGTTEAGGANGCTRGGGCGTIFEVTSAGQLTTLHTFSGTDGGDSSTPLLQATNGVFYGTTDEGGILTACRALGCGTVFALDVGLDPFVKTLPSIGKVGSRVRILENNLTGTTSVAFDGAPATFSVVSDTQITTSVPTSATTGVVEVTTPSGVLKSNVEFHVVQ